MPITRNVRRQPIRTLPNFDEKKRKKVLGLVFLTIFLDLVGFGMFIPVLPLLARQLDATSSQAINLSTWFSLGTFLAVFVFGRISDSIGRKPVLLLTCLVSALAQMLTGFAFNLTFLIVIRFIAGVASGNISVAQACISDATEPSARSKSMVVIGLAFGLGFAFGPAIGSVLLRLWPDEILWPICIAAFSLNLLNFLFVAFFFPETLPVKDDAPLQEYKKPNVFRDSLELFNLPQFKPLILLGFVQVFAFVGFESILSLLLTDTYNMNKVAVYNVFILIGVSLLLVNGLVTRRFVAKFGDIVTLRIGQTLLWVTYFAIPFTAPSVSYLHVSLLILTLGLGLANPSLSGTFSKVVPSEHQGLAFGINQSSAAVARIVGPLFQGLAYQHFSGRYSLLLSGILMILGSFVGLFFVKTSKVVN